MSGSCGRASNALVADRSCKVLCSKNDRDQPSRSRRDARVLDRWPMAGAGTSDASARIEQRPARDRDGPFCRDAGVSASSRGLDAARDESRAAGRRAADHGWCVGEVAGSWRNARRRSRHAAAGGSEATRVHLRIHFEFGRQAALATLLSPGGGSGWSRNQFRSFVPSGLPHPATGLHPDPAE
jgi:hypothetical protein